MPFRGVQDERVDLRIRAGTVGKAHDGLGVEFTWEIPVSHATL